MFSLRRVARSVWDGNINSNERDNEMSEDTNQPIKTNPVKVIRQFCLNCVGGSAEEVRRCTCGPDSGHPCVLYPFRLGKNPYRTKVERTPEQIEAARERFAAMRGKRGAQT